MLLGGFYVSPVFLIFRRLEAFSFASVGRSLRTSIRSPIAPAFWDTVEELYRLSTDCPSGDDGHHDTIRQLRDYLCPILIYCCVRYEMFDKALELIDSYSNVNGIWYI